MSMLRALALLGTGAEGYVEGQNNQAAQSRLASKEAFDQQQRQFQLEQQARVTNQQAADAQAAAPVVPQPDMAPTPAGEAPQQRMLPDPSSDNIDAGQPGTAPPVPAQTVGGQGGLNPMQAQVAAAAANTPEAVQARQIAARQASDPIGAAAMQAHVDAARSSKIDVANKMFDSDLNTAASAVVGGDWTPLEKVLADSGASGKHGAKFLPTPDGKQVEANVVLPDGTLKPTGKFYDNSPEGAQQAAAFLSKATPIQAKVAHALAARSQAEKQAHDEAMESNAAERNKVLENYYTGRNLNGEKAVEAKAKSAIERMSPDDAAEFKALEEKSKGLEAALTKGRLDAAGMGQPFDQKNPTISPLFAQQAAYNMRMKALLAQYREEGAAPDPQGLRSTPKQTATTRPATPMETIQQDMKKRGVTDATATIKDGDTTSTTVIGKGATNTPEPADAPKPGPMAAATAAKPTAFVVDPAMEKKLDAENAEMNGKANRMSYSAEVKAYVDAKKAAQDRADKEKDMAGVEARRKAMFASANRGLR